MQCKVLAASMVARQRHWIKRLIHVFPNLLTKGHCPAGTVGLSHDDLELRISAALNASHQPHQPAITKLKRKVKRTLGTLHEKGTF